MNRFWIACLILLAAAAVRSGFYELVAWQIDKGLKKLDKRK